MSTALDQLIRQGRVTEYTPDLGPRRWPFRRLVMTPDFENWVDQLPETTVVNSRLVSPFDEFEAVASSFIAGRKVVTIMTRIDPPSGEGIVRLKTASFGLLGWADAPQCLVLSRGVSIDASHGSRALELAGRQATAERRALGLDWYRGEFFDLFRAQN